MADPTTLHPTDAPSRRVLRDLLRLRGFQLLLLVRFPASAGDGMFQVGAAALLLFALDPFARTSALEIAQVLAITALPFTVAGPLAGAFVDRWRRQRILLWSNLLRVAIILVGLPLVSRYALALSWGQIGFYTAVLAALAVNRFFLVTSGAVVPRVVPGEALVAANAIAATGSSISALFGAGLGGAVSALVGDTRGGPEVAILGGVALYVLAALAAHRLPTASLGPDLAHPLPPLRETLRQTAREVADGFRAMRRARRAWAPIVGFSLLRLVITAASIAGLLVFRNVYGAGSEAITYVLVAFGLGVFVGAVVVTGLDRRTALRPEQSLRVALAIAGIAMLIFSPGLRRVPLVAMSGVMGVGFGFAKVATDTLLQGALPDRYRGRLFTAYDIVVNLAFVSGGVLAAVGLPRAGSAEAVYLAGGIALTALALLSRRWLGSLPPPVDVETWDEAEHAADPTSIP